MMEKFQVFGSQSCPAVGILSQGNGMHLQLYCEFGNLAAGSSFHLSLLKLFLFA